MQPDAVSTHELAAETPPLASPAPPRLLTSDEVRPPFHSPTGIHRLMFADENWSPPRSWRADQPLPSPHEAIFQTRLRGLGPAQAVTADIERELFAAFFKRSISFPSLALEFDIELSVLLDFFDRDDVQARLRKIRNVTLLREEVIAAERSCAAIAAMERCCKSLDTEDRHDPKSTPAARARLYDVTRRAGSHLLRRVSQIRDALVPDHDPDLDPNPDPVPRL